MLALLNIGVSLRGLFFLCSFSISKWLDLQLLWSWLHRLSNLRLLGKLFIILLFFMMCVAVETIFEGLGSWANTIDLWLAIILLQRIESATASALAVTPCLTNEAVT